MQLFMQQYLHGTLRGVLRWEQLEALWTAVAGKSGWYAYDLDAPPPEVPVAAEGLQAFIRVVDTTLRTLHRQEHCGIVYVDDPGDPGFVKIYHPRRIGGCGGSGKRVFPGWILSRLPPVDVMAELAPVGKFTLFKQLFRKGVIKAE